MGSGKQGLVVGCQLSGACSGGLTRGWQNLRIRARGRDLAELGGRKEKGGTREPRMVLFPFLTELGWQKSQLSPLLRMRTSRSGLSGVGEGGACSHRDEGGATYRRLSSRLGGEPGPQGGRGGKEWAEGEERGGLLSAVGPEDEGGGARSGGGGGARSTCGVRVAEERGDFRRNEPEPCWHSKF